MQADLREAAEAAAWLEATLLRGLPPPDEFPFALRLAADASAAGGGETALAVCAASLAAQDAGVPLQLVSGRICGAARLLSKSFS